MISVTGKVTLAGKEINNGQILFRRTSGEQKGYEAQIKNGNYEVTCEQGEVKVQITAYRDVPGKFTTVNGPKEPVQEMYIPAKYNDQTTLLRTLTPESLIIDFEL